MVDATAKSCLLAFITEWIPRFGLPSQAVSDNGSSFISQLWKGIHEALGIVVSYTPPLHPQSLGSLERQHRDLKSGLRTALYQMGDRYGSQWSMALPWILLGRRTTYSPDLDTSPAEMLYGQLPRLPGDLVDNGGQSLVEMLEGVRTNAARPSVPTAHHAEIPIYVPDSAKTATHVLQRIGKPTQFGPRYDGPFKIIERIGKSILKIRCGNWANGQPRHELTHWNNCVPAPNTPLVSADKPRRGRKLNVEAAEFVPTVQQSAE